MIFNAYAVLAIFVGLVELGLGVAVVRLAISALVRRRAVRTPDDPHDSIDERESHVALLLLLSFALIVASVASWPLLYLLLASYIPEWVGVMCIQGVVRVGTGSEGAAGWLPTLVHVLEVTKPALVFAAGAWLLLHLANRRTRTGPLAGRALGALLVVGALATLDAGAQLAYVGIPKKERFLATGCCVVPQELTDRAATFGLSLAPKGRTAASKKALVIAFYALTGALVVGTRWGAARRSPRAKAEATDTHAGRAAVVTPWMTLTIGALVGLPVALAFLTDVASSAFLGRPDHDCAYCLLTTSPLAVAAILAYILGTFATGWAGVADLFATHDETVAFLPAKRRRLLQIASLGYLAALALTTGRLLLP